MNSQTSSGNEQLPPNWERRIDGRTGWPYYINHSTKTTHWEHPSQVLASTSSHTEANPSPSSASGATIGGGIQIPVQQQNPEPSTSQDHTHRLDGSNTSQNLEHHNGSVERDRSPIPPSPRRSPAPPGSASRGRGQTRKTSSSASDKSSLPGMSASDASLDIIDGIRRDAEEFHAKIESFVSSKESKDYKYLEEMMERNLLKLDNIDTHGVDEVRLKRKETVKFIQECLDQLELKALANDTDIAN